MNKQMPPRLPTASEMGITTEINAVDTDIKEVEIEISQVKAALDGKGVYLGISDPDKLFMELQQLREKEKQLRDKEKQLREEKKQLLREEKKQLREEKELLRENKKQLRDEMLRPLLPSGKPLGWYFTPVSR